MSLYFICQQNISATIIAVAASFHCSRKAILGWLFRGVQGIAQVFFSAKKRTNQFLRCGRDRYQCAALAIGSAKATTNQFLRSQVAFLKSISILGDHQPRPEDCSPSSIRQEERQRNDTFVLLPRIEASLHVVVRNSTKRRKLNPRQKRVTFGYLQNREYDDMLSSHEKQVMRKELREMVQKNDLEVEEEERIEEERIEEEKRMREMERSMSSSSRLKAQIDDTEEEDDYGSAFVNDDEEDDTNGEYCEAIVDVVDVDIVEEDTVVVKKEEKKKTHSTRPRRSLRLLSANLGSGYTESGRRFSRRLKALK